MYKHMNMGLYIYASVYCANSVCVLRHTQYVCMCVCACNKLYKKCVCEECTYSSMASTYHCHINIYVHVIV